MELRPFLIEQWFREYDFRTEITLCSSGVAPYSLGEVRERLDLAQDELDRVVLQDTYSHGHPELRHQIARQFGDGNAERVLVTHGSSEAIFLMMNALLREGDEVVALLPSYQSLYSIAQDRGCHVRHWVLRPEDGFAPDIDALRRLLTPRTHAVVVNFPNNPTGVSLDGTQFDELIAAVQEVGSYLLWDDAFGMLRYGNCPRLAPERCYERTVVFRTLSKAYGLPGLRIGWCQAAPELVERCVGMRDYTTLNLSPLNEFIARRALERAECLLAPRWKQAQANLEYLAAWVDRHRGYVDWVRPQGGVSAFLHLCGRDGEEFCKFLARRHGVFLLPGSCFGYPGHIRLGFGGATGTLQEGLSRLSLGIAATSGRLDGD